MECDHRWNSDKEIRYCLDCGQIRIFPVSSEEEPRIVWTGRDDERDPTTLTKEDKALITTLAKDNGVKHLSMTIGIDSKILRAWVNRPGKRSKGETYLLGDKKDQFLLASINDSFIPVIPPFNEAWAPEVQVEWFRIITAIYHEIHEKPVVIGSQE